MIIISNQLPAKGKLIYLYCLLLHFISMKRQKSRCTQSSCDDNFKHCVTFSDHFRYVLFFWCVTTFDRALFFVHTSSVMYPQLASMI